MKGLDNKYFYLVDKLSIEEENGNEKEDIVDQSAVSNLNMPAIYNPIIMLVDWEKLFYSRVEKVKIFLKKKVNRRRCNKRNLFRFEHFIRNV